MKVREAAAQAIGQMGAHAIPHLIDMLQHEDKYVRRNAVWALSKIGPQSRSALPALCRTLKDADPRTATGAAQAIGSMGESGADGISALAEAMRGTNIVLCRLAAKALSQIGPAAVSSLVAHLQHADPFVRGEAALAIGWLGPVAKSAVPYLTQVLRGRDSRTLRDTPAPTNGIDRSAVSGASGDEAASSETPVGPKPDTSTPDETCRVFAAQALGRLGVIAAPAVAELRIASHSGPDPLRQAATKALRLIQPNEESIQKN